MSAEAPPEVGIFDDLATGSDLKAKLAHAWREFAQALAQALPALPPGSELDITLDPTASGTGPAVYGVSLRAGDSGALGALAIGNASLPEGYQLDRTAVAHLVELGWSPPGVEPGSGADFGLSSSAAQAAQIAATVSRTLRDVYGAPHPAFLTYDAQAADHQAVAIAPLGSARPRSSTPVGSAVARGSAVEAAAADDTESPLPDRVMAIVAALLKTTPDALQVDGDGDIGIRSGSAMVFVRVRDNPPLVDVFSPVLTEIKPTEALYAKLSDLTNRMPVGRLYYAKDTVWASIPVFGRDFQPTHLMLAVQVMTGLADELDDRLHGEFGGRRFFDTDKPALQGQPEQTGMYL
jgi:hypothetical protein